MKIVYAICVINTFSKVKITYIYVKSTFRYMQVISAQYLFVKVLLNFIKLLHLTQHFQILLDCVCICVQRGVDVHHSHISEYYDVKTTQQSPPNKYTDFNAKTKTIYPHFNRCHMLASVVAGSNYSRKVQCVFCQKIMYSSFFYYQHITDTAVKKMAKPWLSVEEYTMLKWYFNVSLNLVLKC